MKAFSIDLRERIVKMYEAGKQSYNEVAELFDVSRSSVKRFLKQWRSTGAVSPKPAANGSRPFLDDAANSRLIELVREQTNSSQDDLRRLLAEETGILVSQPTISRTLKRLHITRKKKTIRATEQLRDDVKAARQAFEEELKTMHAEDVIAVDEMGCVTGMSRPYGYAPCGERATAYEPACKGTRISVLGALSVDGFLGGMEVTGSFNGDVFEAFIEQMVVPALCPGKIVILDNISFHHMDGIREMIEAKGAKAKFLPAYSPEFNPIEECWSKIKAWLRKKTDRTNDDLRASISEAIQRITSTDAQGWFRHAGYQVQ